MSPLASLSRGAEEDLGVPIKRCLRLGKTPALHSSSTTTPQIYSNIRKNDRISKLLSLFQHS